MKDTLIRAAILGGLLFCLIFLASVVGFVYLVIWSWSPLAALALVGLLCLYIASSR